MTFRLVRLLEWAALAAVLGGCALPPKPTAWLFRAKLDREARQVAERATKFVPAGVTTLADIRYDEGDADALLDVHYPSVIDQTGDVRTTIVWVHGGGWVSGSKDYLAPWLRTLAAQGYTVVGLDYSLSPEHRYPVPLRQVMTALSYLQRRGAALHVDATRIVIGGDSAGGHIAAQVGTVVTSPDYARDIGIAPTIAPSQLKAMLFTCGTFGFDGDFPFPYGYYVRTLLLSYFGSEDTKDDPFLKTVHVQAFMTSGFPRSFITAGNDDPLEFQSRKLADRLSGLGVPIDTLFFAPDDRPQAQHEYQLELDSAKGRLAMTRIAAFLETLKDPGR
ncbi:alpha/beta hydrolase [soil metagenome]